MSTISIPGGPFLPGNFLALPPELSSLDTARVVLLPVPYDSTTSYRSGTREGPGAILEASRHLEEFDEELEREPCQVGIHTLPLLEPHVGDPEAMVRRVAQTVASLAGQGKLVGLLGGEHSLSIGAVQGLRKQFANLSVLYLDAHADLRDTYQGTPFSHACTARRILEHCPLVAVGVRSLSQEEWEFVHARQVPLFLWSEGHPMEELSREVLNQLGPQVYISIDLDVFDPGFMPAVGTPEPGGMSWHQVLALLRTVSAQRRIVGFDLTELAPALGPPACSYTAARLAYKLIGYSALRE
ncbi:MAG: agmatinase [Chloroflexi bacterium]|nr:agmatinase [Chloroflexota bacterium]